MTNFDVMYEQENINYRKVVDAIDFIQNHLEKQPTEAQVVEKLNLSPQNFQKLITDWAGTSPQQFLRYISIEYAKTLLKGKTATLFSANISDTNRTPDSFIKIEGMTVDEYKNGGAALSINFSFTQSPFGNILVASTLKGICHLTFIEDKNQAFTTLQKQFPNAKFKQQEDPIHQNSLNIFSDDSQKTTPLKLHLKGTEFQLNVWAALLKIPMGQLSTYGNIANQIGKPTAARAVGTAIGDNPVAFLVPCHRVIQSTGKMRGYMWGTTRKIAIIGWEASKINIT